MKTCRNCKWRFSNICEWRRKFLANLDAPACQDHAPRPQRPEGATWCGPQLQWQAVPSAAVTAQSEA